MARPFALALLALTAPLRALARDVPALLVPPCLGRPDAVWVFGRVLEEEQGRHGPRPLRTARTLTGGNLRDATVEVTFLGRAAVTTSGHDGEFEVELRPADGETFPPGVHQATVRVQGVTASVRVQVVRPDAPFLLVSDFDDTVAITHVTRTSRVIASTFLKDGDTHPPVPAMSAFYRCLAAQGAPVAFVSGSPVQFAPRLVRFLEKNGFPPAALFLRNLGLDTLRGGYKEPVLDRLARRFPGLPFVLVGDTGERDPEIYADFSAAHPGRVLRIYLRRATEDPVPPVRWAGAYLFQDPALAAQDAAMRGLADPACLATPFP